MACEEHKLAQPAYPAYCWIPCRIQGWHSTGEDYDPLLPSIPELRGMFVAGEAFRTRGGRKHEQFLHAAPAALTAVGCIACLQGCRQLQL
jgi:hypothetical protein